MTDHIDGVPSRIQINKADSHYEERKQLLRLFEQEVDSPTLMTRPDDWDRMSKEDRLAQVKLCVDSLQLEDNETLKLVTSLLFEEFFELIEAIRDGEPAERVLHEACDLGVVTEGMCAMYGWDYDTARKRVHKSQLTKLVDGKPVKNEQGKFIKGPNYQAPDLTDLV